ncbi:hypothetical protein NDU88_004607 [Pleurodeles waltl]|uniref:Secreted protein n=1 Tax=Pleurodeles waltl TaxID=8319 RepID=A0AAV7LRG7_PLEWA|nr:hypothetical protein NDU88_004607 [Pleurodeles waltl]
MQRVSRRGWRRSRYCGSTGCMPLLLGVQTAWARSVSRGSAGCPVALRWGNGVTASGGGSWGAESFRRERGVQSQEPSIRGNRVTLFLEARNTT